MAIFYWHPYNQIATKLREYSGVKGFSYTSRGELELKLQRFIAGAGYDLWPTFHTVIGSIANLVTQYIEMDPDDPLDALTLKLCNSANKKPAPWTFVKILNGPQMTSVVGYCNSSPSQPFAMSNAEMAQKGIIGASYVPRVIS